MSTRDGIDGTYEASDATPPHHLYWNLALQDAVRNAAKTLDPGQDETYSVSFKINVVKTNPGWINRYIVTLG